MKTLPKSRDENIIVQNLSNEVLIYDTITNQAFCLNETSAKVYNACDGDTSFAELKSKHKFTDELIFLALDELKAKKLLAESAEYQTPFAGMSRREVIRKVGLASMVALPMISSLVAPSAANAASGGSSCSVGTCMLPGGNVCAGCAGRPVSFERYNANTGCSGNTVAFPSIQTCPANGDAPNLGNFDYRISQVT